MGCVFECSTRVASICYSVYRFVKVKRVEITTHYLLQLVACWVAKLEVNGSLDSIQNLSGDYYALAVGSKGSSCLTTSSPSEAIVATFRYLLMSQMWVNFLEGRVPCRRWEWVR